MESLDREGLKAKINGNWFIPGVIAAFLIAFGIRYYPVRNIQYLQAMDPYNLFRMSQQIAYTGSLPDLDFMRYFPYAMPTYTAHQLNLWIPALLYIFGGQLFFDSYLDFAYLMMPLFSGLAAVAMYFLGREIYDKYTGLAAAFFIAVLPGAIFRSSAGFFEKEATGTFFMVFSLLFFILAWKKTSWIHGMISGTALGIFTATWGGSQVLWLLYPMTVGFMLLINEDIENLVAAYTPTVILAAIVAITVNPGRTWIDDMYIFLTVSFLAALWLRYLVGELELLTEEKLGYFIPGLYGAGSIAVLLSPLYSQTIASTVYSLYSRVFSSGGVISGTVAEDAAPGLEQLTAQLGLGTLQIFPGSGLITSPVSAWTLVFLAVPLMASTAVLMLAKKYSLIDSLAGKAYYSLTAGTIASWAIGFMLFFDGYRTIGIAAAITGTAAVLAASILLEEESAFNITGLALLFTGFITSIYAIGATGTTAVMRGISYPVWAAALGLGIIYIADNFKEREIELSWIKILPLFWLGSSLLAATARSRLIYLAAFPVALGAGYTFSRVFRKLQDIEIDIDFEWWRPLALTIFAAGVISVNFAAGFATSSSVSGSPNEAWMESLDYLNEESEPGSVVLSWWDYGYHFQSLGRSASVADGGNFNYYTDEERVNFELAEYLASDDPDENFERLYDQHSVDYVMMDNTMIGKYQAVSQIALRDNEDFDTMYQATTPGTFEQASDTSDNRTVVEFIGTNIEAQIFVPVEDGEISDSATLQYPGGRTEEASCVLTDQGIQEFGDGESEFCIAEDPYPGFETASNFNTQASLVLVPREISEHNLMRLYLMDGHGIDYLEKVEEASNRYIKTWKVQ